MSYDCILGGGKGRRKKKKKIKEGTSSI